MRRKRDPQFFTDESKAELAVRLIERATYRVPQFADSLRRSNMPDGSKVTRALEVLDALADLDERGADEDWYRDYFTLTGQHMQLTEEGWVPADQNTREVTGEEPMEVFDEVNAPVVS